MPKLEEGQSTGTVYVGYIGQYAKFHVTPGQHRIRVGCVSLGGWSGGDSVLDTVFTINAGEDKHFMITFDSSCKKPKKSDLALVMDKKNIDRILGYRYLDFKQSYAVKSQQPVLEDAPCCNINGRYHQENPLHGDVTIVQHGAQLEMWGHDLLMPTFEQLKAAASKPYKAGPEIIIAAKWWG